MTRRGPLSVLAASALVLAAASPALAEESASEAEAPQSASSSESPMSGAESEKLDAEETTGAESSDDAARSGAITAPAASTTIDILAITDFHGHIEKLVDSKTNAVKEPGAVTLSCEVDAARAANPNTLFVSNGDNVGGSAYISSVLDDDPTIEVLNAMRLDVTSAGNHEFDQGVTDLVGDIIPSLNAPVLAANVTGNATLSAEGAGNGAFVKEIGGVKVGFVGVVTDELPSLVAKSALEGLTVAPAIETANARAKALKEAGADLVVVLAHADAELNASLLSDDVDALVGGHSHLEYARVVALKSGKTIPVVQPANYGTLLGKISLTLAGSDGGWTIVDESATNINLLASACEGDPYGVGAIVSDAVAESETAGAAVLAQLGSDFLRGTNSGADFGTNRSTESTASDLIADSFRSWLTGIAPAGDHLVGLMNPGGVREDYRNKAEDPRYPFDLTEKMAFQVQPFGNEMAYATYTGAQFKRVLAEQFQPTTSRAALMLGVSDNVEVCLDQTAVAELEGYWDEWKAISALPADEQDALKTPLVEKIADARGRVIACVVIDGEKLSDDASVVVASNSFLLAGGDNFDTLGAQTMTNTGILDRTATADYLKGLDTPATADLVKRQIGVSTEVEEGSARIGLAGLLYSATSEQGVGAAGKSVTASVTMADGSVRALATVDIDPTVTPGLPDTGTASLAVEVPEGAAVAACPEGVKGETCAKLVLTLTGVDGSTRTLPCGVSVPVVPPAAPEPPVVEPTAPRTPTETGVPAKTLAKTGENSADLLAGALVLALAGAAFVARRR